MTSFCEKDDCFTKVQTPMVFFLSHKNTFINIHKSVIVINHS